MSFPSLGSTKIDRICAIFAPRISVKIWSPTSTIFCGGSSKYFIAFFIPYVRGLSPGAYYKGDSKNKMLQRIYGICFENEDTRCLELFETIMSLVNFFMLSNHNFTPGEIVGLPW